MYSQFAYRDNSSGETHTVTLVYPGEQDIAAWKVSVLTPGWRRPHRSQRGPVDRMGNAVGRLQEPDRDEDSAAAGSAGTGIAAFKQTV